mmetsp:Transcript_4662/g.10298  ORF Transcript_4662/g.10298 Transcript_4662/m.10298 type:complete len:94 (+) Transcript_4662:869-1150(+)
MIVAASTVQTKCDALGLVGEGGGTAVAGSQAADGAAPVRVGGDTTIATDMVTGTGMGIETGTVMIAVTATGSEARQAVGARCALETGRAMSVV